MLLSPLHRFLLASFAFSLGTLAGSAQLLKLDWGGAVTFYPTATFSYRFVQPNVQATYYTAISGDASLCRVMNYSRECAATDTAQPFYLDWASTVNLPSSSAYQRYPDFQLYPTCANAFAPVFNLNGATTTLVLTLQTLAKIWSGRITTWDHPDIQASNPNFAMWNIPANQSIALVGRPDTVGATTLFKKVLAAADSTFPVSVPNWNGLKVTSYQQGPALVAHVLRYPYTLGYAAAGDAMGIVPMAKLNRSGTIVEASAASVQYAVLEKGLSFGNNGDDPAHLTCDLTNAVNPLAWPIVSYSYIGVRKSTLRPGATCAAVAAMMDFWLWFWNSDEVAALGSKQGYVALPEVVRDTVVDRFKADIWCGGRQVWQEAEVPVVAGYGLESATPIFDKFQQAYEMVNQSVMLNYTTLASEQVAVSSVLQAGGFLVSTSSHTAPNVFSLVLGLEAVVAISMQTALVLNGLTLAKILNGDITTWLHDDILALNPGGIKSNGQRLNDTAQRIVLLRGPTATSAALTALLQGYYPPYTGAAIQAAEKFTREALLWAAITGTPYSFSVTALVGDLPNTVLQAAIVSRSGATVAPSLATATACTDAATYDAATNAVLSSASPNSSCYPLLLPLYVSLQRQCPPPPATARAVAFLQWMFTEATLKAALEALNLVSLYGVSDAVEAANVESLFQLSCQEAAVPATPTDLVPLLLAIIIPVGAVVLVGGALCGWWLWRTNEANRALRKKFSNDNVAVSCAEAIARFDLAAVAWLQEVKEPNKIQLAFLAIISLLTEVKPYIPDQLISQLTKAEAGSSDHEPLSPPPPSPLLGRESNRRSGGELRLEHQSSTTSARSSSHHCTTISSSEKLGHLATIEEPKQVLALKDWRRKRCTYLCVRFGCEHLGEERRLAGLVQAAGRIVDIAKSHGATVDTVTLEFITVHWGITSAASALRAIQAGQELARACDVLAEEQPAPLWVQVGIGKGLCDCGAVSSESGHRFFVVWGAEVSLAIKVATSHLPKTVLATVLVSPAVQQEVQYTVQCMPRLWHGDALLWEPRALLKKREDDEWMYELQAINDASSLTSKALLEACMMARDKTVPVARLSAFVAELRALHKMTPQDLASLDLLLSTAGVPQTPTMTWDSAKH